MEFDESRVYTAVNADQLKVGSQVICADTLWELESDVRREAAPEVLEGILSKEMERRFQLTRFHWALAYLVSEPSKLKWTDLKVGDVIRRGDNTRMVIGIEADAADMHILIGGRWVDDEELELWEKVVV